MKRKLLLIIPLTLCLLFTLAIPCFATSQNSTSSFPNYNPLNYSFNIYNTSRSNSPYLTNKPTSHDSSKIPYNSPLNSSWSISDGVTRYEVHHEYIEPSDPYRIESATSISSLAYSDDVGDNYYRAYLTIAPTLLYPSSNTTTYLPTLVDYEGQDYLRTDNTTRIKYTYVSKDTNKTTTKEYTRTSKRVRYTDNYFQSLHIAWSQMISDYLANAVENTPLSVDTCYCYIPSISYTLTNARTTTTNLLLTDYYFFRTNTILPTFTAKVPPIRTETIEADFTSWIGNAVQGFWSFQLFPNITIGTIIIAILGLMFTIGFLKYFAGG